MTQAGDEISNPRTGQRMVFLQTGKATNGGLLRNESYVLPAGDAEPEHTHPFQQSGAEVSQAPCASAWAPRKDP